MPLLLKVTSPMNIRLPQQTIKLESHVEPSDRQVTYQWTYIKDGPVTPTLQVNHVYFLMSPISSILRIPMPLTY